MRLISLVTILAFAATVEIAVASGWRDQLSHADVLDTNGWHDSALVVGKAALQAAASENGPDDSSVVVVLMRLSDYFFNRGETDSSLTILNRAHDIFRRSYGQDNRMAATLLRELGNAAYWNHQYKDALSFYRGADRTLILLGDTFNLERARVLASLGSTCCSLNKYSEASKHYREALRIRESLLPVYHPVRLLTHLNIASCCAARDDQGCIAEEEAIVMGQPLLDISPAKAQDARSYMSLAEQCIDRGYPEVAEKAYACALRIRQAVLGPKHRYVGETLKKMADLYSHTGRTVEADSAYAEAIEVMAGCVPPGYAELESAKSALQYLRERK